MFATNSTGQPLNRPTGIVKQRIDQMEEIGRAIKQLGKIMKGTTPYSPKDIATLARAVELRSGNHLVELYPKGSMKYPTKAMPSIWRQRPDFIALAGDMARHARLLAASADHAAKAQNHHRALRRTCRDCHDRHRARRD
jgi:cytochrome c556